MKFSFEYTTPKNIREFSALTFILFSLAFVLYYIPPPIREYLFLPTLYFTWKSKKDYFWIAFFFLMTDIPGGLFSGMEKIDPYGLPMYKFGGLSISILELFYIVAFLKAVNNSIKAAQIYNFFKTELMFVMGLFFVLLLVSLALGTSYVSMKLTYKTMIYLTIFYSFYKLIDSKEKLFRFFGLLFPFSFMAVALQLFSLIFKKQLVSLFKPSVTVVQGVLQVTEGSHAWVRPIEMAHVLLICFAATLFLISFKKHNYNRTYLMIVNLVSFFGILLTGTRSWILAFFTAYLYFFVVTYKNTKTFLKMLSVSGALAAVIIYFVPVLEQQALIAWDRFMTVQDILEGDITAGGTMGRYDQRAPRVMDGFYASTIFFGAGFSDHYYAYHDAHVGYHNILLNTGVLGSLIFLFFLLRLLSSPFKKKGRQENIDTSWLKVSILPLIILLVLNSGTQTLGFKPDGSNRFIIMSFAFVLINFSLTLTRERKYSVKPIGDIKPNYDLPELNVTQQLS